MSRGEALSGNVAVVGAQWGDEGKGKIVDWLSERADVVVRFQGGHNAGHTLVIACRIQTQPAPSGCAPRQVVDHRQRRGRRSVGADQRDRRDPRKGVEVTRNLKLADNARSSCRHTAPSTVPRGATRREEDWDTGRGIGPAYEDKVGRRAIRVCDLGDPKRSNGESTMCCCTTMLYYAGSVNRGRPR